MHPAPLQATEVPHLAAPSSIDKLREWQIKNGDLAVGPLGGLNGRCHCAACRAPLFSREANTKCCLGRLREGAEWYGPFCTYPYVQRPTGEYGSLWYNDTDADAKYFRGNTRLLNCRYAYSSLQVLSMRRKVAPMGGYHTRARTRVWYPRASRPARRSPRRGEVRGLDKLKCSFCHAFVPLPSILSLSYINICACTL